MQGGFVVSTKRQPTQNAMSDATIILVRKRVEWLASDKLSQYRFMSSRVVHSNNARIYEKAF